MVERDERMHDRGGWAHAWQRETDMCSEKRDRYVLSRRDGRMLGRGRRTEVGREQKK